VAVSGSERGTLCCPVATLPREVMRREPLGANLVSCCVTSGQGARGGGDAAQDGWLCGLRVGSGVGRGRSELAALLSCKKMSCPRAQELGRLLVGLSHRRSGHRASLAPVGREPIGMRSWWSKGRGCSWEEEDVGAPHVRVRVREGKCIACVRGAS